MKQISWSVLSLALNVILLGTVMVLVAGPETAATGSKASAPPTTNLESPLPSRNFSTGDAVAANANDSDWRQWLGQLRAAGVPDKVLAELTVSDFESRWQKQRSELQRRYDRGDVDDETMTRFVEQHDADQEKELITALGPDGFLKWDKANVLNDINPDKIKMSSSETDAVYQLRKDLAQKQHDLEQAHQSGQIDESDLDAQQTASEKDYDEKLKSLLGDARYATLKAPEDGAQGQLKRALKTLNAAGSQLDAMLQAQQQWAQRRAELELQQQENQGGNESYEQQMQALDASRDATYQNVLGADGFDQLKKLQDGRYATMQHFATAWQLSTSDVDYVYGVLQSSEKNIQDYRQQAHDQEAQGQAVDWTAIEANVQQLTQQSQQSLHDYLGDDRFNKLQRNDVFSLGN